MGGLKRCLKEIRTCKKVILNFGRFSGTNPQIANFECRCPDCLIKCRLTNKTDKLMSVVTGVAG